MITPISLVEKGKMLVSFLTGLALVSQSKVSFGGRGLTPAGLPGTTSHVVLLVTLQMPNLKDKLVLGQVQGGGLSRVKM